jgi:predicted GTPase
MTHRATTRGPAASDEDSGAGGKRLENRWPGSSVNSDHVGVKQYRNRNPLDGADVVLVGLFSADEKQYDVRLDELAALAEARGGRVVGRHVQRRGASDRWNERPGGASRMSLPFSCRTLLTHGKIREIAEACREADIDAAVFVNTLTPRQRTVLTRMLGCLVVSRDDLAAHGASG